jgi:crotonobetainyl-CoA:carnitine CoA-transferase CaiB-like acyl-CoA transferase
VLRSAARGPGERIPRPEGDDPGALLAALWRSARLPGAALDQVRIEGSPLLPGVFRVGDVASVCTAAAALAAAEVAHLRGAPRQPVKVDMAHAEIAYRSERYLQVDGDWADPFNPFWGYYRTADDRYVQLHTSFPHHLSGALDLLQVPADPEQVRAAVARWRAAELEDALYLSGLPGSMLRSRQEWLAHPHGRALQAMPLLEIARIGDAPPEPLRGAGRPLQGLRVLDLTRVIAGPVCGRTLADHGAEVLRVQGPHIPYIPLLAIDTGRGKRATYLDLRAADERARFESLLGDADVFVQGYRPGTIAARGYGADAAHRLRPGIVCVSVCAYGDEGPWGDRRGFDSLVQVASGIAHAGAQARGQQEPLPLPCQALDHSVGYLAAFGALVALVRRITEGGSWHVRISLAQAGEWLQGLGEVAGLDRPEPSPRRVAHFLRERRCFSGSLREVTPVCELLPRPAPSDYPDPMAPSAPCWLS